MRSAPVPHRLAARPHVDLIEPGVQPTAPACAYRLKIGSHGKVGFLLLSKDGQERSGPVALWDWRLGECIGVSIKVTNDSLISLLTTVYHSSPRKGQPSRL